MRTLEIALLVVHRRGVAGREFLVALRSPERSGYWHLVGGGLEDGETPAQAACRELREETGLARPVSIEQLPISLGYVDDGDWIMVHVFAVEAPHGWEPVLDEEHVEHRWCSAEEAVDVLAYEEPREAVREAVRRLGVTA